jgi:excisionase family DNA binding protein
MRYLNTVEVANVLGVCAGTIRNWVKAGKLKAIVHPTGRRKYERSAVLAFIQEHGLPDSYRRSLDQYAGA